jgi:hypothetical protein
LKVETLLRQYETWVSDPAVHAIILKGAGEKVWGLAKHEHDIYRMGSTSHGKMNKVL